jgi:hypothetical protein
MALPPAVICYALRHLRLLLQHIMAANIEICEL